MIIVENKKQFSDIIKNTKPIIIVFTKPDCPSCKLYVEYLDKFHEPSKAFFHVDINSDLEYYINVVKLAMFLPDTRIYKKEKLIARHSGILFKKQITEIYDIVQENWQN